VNEEIPDEIRDSIRRVVAEVYADHPPAAIERAVVMQEEAWLRKLNSKSYLNAGTFPDPRAKERRWVCFSTAIDPVWLMLYCKVTGAEGVVKDPTREEWGWASDCPSNPKPWPVASRVTLMKEGNR